MNPKPGWIFALLPRFDKTALKRVMDAIERAVVAHKSR